MTELNVDIAALHTHASAVHGVGDQVDSAGRAASDGSFGIDTFGLIGQLFCFGARDAAGEAAEAIRGTAVGLHDLATSITSTAEQYARSEDDNTVAFGGGPR